MSRFVVGVDVGTGSARAGVFSVADGARVGVASFPIKMRRPQPDWAEQSSTDIWDAVGKSVREAMEKADVSPENVVGIGFDATCSLVVLGGEESFWDVIVWMDHRAIAEADEINTGDFEVLKYVGGKISPEMEIPKLLWLKRNAPATWGSATAFFDLPDFLVYKASGQDARSLCTNVCKWTYLGHEGRWDTDFLDTIGLNDSRITSSNIRPLGERVGPLTSEAAAHLGLTESCQVAVGIIDAHAGGLGLLGLADGAPESALALIGGTSNCHMAASNDPIFVPGVWGPYFGAMVPGLWLTEGGQSAAGALIDYVIEDSSEYARLAHDAEAAGVTIYTLLNAKVAALADAEGLSDVAYLTRHLHTLDFHLGNRSPFADPHARGVVEGLPLDHSLDLDARLYLSAIQAVAYGTRAIIEAMNQAGFAIETVLATGGGTKNPLWLAQHADALGVPLRMGEETESVLLGAAILGAHASGDYASVTDAMKAMARPGPVVTPNPETRAYHDAKYAIWRDLYAAQKRHRATMDAI
ncbi:MAG: FGGY-family carbohydrate kinase [Armatimonas sp.]